MALQKVQYTDKQTVIPAKNLNDIQDAIIELENKPSGGGTSLLKVYLYCDEDGAFSADETSLTIYNAVFNESKDAQLIYEDGDGFVRIYNLQYCDEECATFGFQDGGYAASFTVYDDGMVDHQEGSLVKEDDVRNNYLSKPHLLDNAGTIIVGTYKDGTTHKINASKFAIPNCLAKYDANGRLRTKYYSYDTDGYEEDYAATEQYVWREISNVSPVGFGAYEDHDYRLWMNDEDFDIAMSQIYDGWRHVVLYIEYGDGDVVEQIWGAEAVPDNDCIIFGNRFIWHRDDNRLYPYTPPETKKYELIETITLKEPTLEIIRTQEPGGAVYKFEEMIVRATFPAYTVSGNANITISYNIGSHWENRVKSYFLSPYDASSMKFGYNRIWTEGGKYFTGWWTCVRGDGEYANYYENPATIGKYGRNNGNITKLTLTTVIDMPVGTTFEIWAVRAGSNGTVIPNGDEVSY